MSHMPQISPRTGLGLQASHHALLGASITVACRRPIGSLSRMQPAVVGSSTEAAVSDEEGDRYKLTFVAHSL